VRDLHADGSITLYENAVVAKDASGKLLVREGGEAQEETFFGLLTGRLVGLLGVPLGVAVGAGTGTLIPELRRFLLRYPNAELAGADSFFYWGRRLSA